MKGFRRLLMWTLKVQVRLKVLLAVVVVALYLMICYAACLMTFCVHLRQQRVRLPLHSERRALDVRLPLYVVLALKRALVVRGALKVDRLTRAWAVMDV